MSYAIEITDLKKKYGNHEVLKGINFCVEHGEVFGILGINGAGKTTILECIEGFRKYHSGNIGKYWYSITISFVTCLYESK
jgi:ABC-2 type transport system ATP-binding protein